MSIEILDLVSWKELLKNAENGDNVSQLEVAELYENGKEFSTTEHIIVNNEKAFYWIKRAYENGNKNALVKYADYLSAGIHCDKNISLAIETYKKGIELGISIASYNLGIEYRNMLNFKTAFKYYLKAKELDSFNEDFTIAKCYYYGIGIEKDRKKAFEILKNIKLPNSTEYEVDEANYYIGEIYLEGEVVEKSLEKSRYYLELANKDGDHNSAKELLLIIGTTENIKTSVQQNL